MAVIPGKEVFQDGPPFSSTEYAARAAGVCERLAEAGLDGVLLAQPESICYLTGYETNGVAATVYLVVSGNGDLLFLTRRLDIGNLLPLLPVVGIKDYAVYDDDGDPIAVLVDLLRRNGLSRARIGVEKASLYFPVAHYENLAQTLPSSSLVDSGPLVERLRLVKSAAEIECHRVAARFAVTGMTAAIAAARPGASDASVAAAALAALVDAGSSWMANWPYVRIGRNTGRGHATWQNAVLDLSMPLTVELAGVARRYHSPLYRTVVFHPTGEQRRLAEAVRAANRTGIAAMAPGGTAEEVYAAFRSAVLDAGLGDLLRHRNAYAVGIGFPPNWVQRPGLDIMSGNQARLEAGMVFHVPTYLCVANEYGMGQSATVLITDSGHEILTTGIVDGPLLYD